jgi:hypothetical protein
MFYSNSDSEVDSKEEEEEYVDDEDSLYVVDE